MALFLFKCEEAIDYIEAASVSDAVLVWREHYDLAATDEPTEVVTLSDFDVIKARQSSAG